MIRIEKIEVHEFRGIRDCVLELQGRNHAICGRNGTGKSGIVDAIEFALTGTIGRLTGAGTGGISVKDHGPHVDIRKKPQDAWVSVHVSIPALNGKEASIRRTVKAPNKPVIVPLDADVVSAFEKVANHPEFVLSRRELIQYVLSEAGKRAEQVQALLRLGDVEKVRGTLAKISNAYTKSLTPLASEEMFATTKLLTTLAISQMSESEMLAAVNSRRQVLGLAPLLDTEATTNLTDGMAASAAAAQSRIAKVEARKDLSTLTDALAALKSDTLSLQCQVAMLAARDLLSDAALLNSVTRESLLRTALDEFDDKTCPVCSTPFDPDRFREHIAAELRRLADATRKRQELEAHLSPILSAITNAGSGLAAIINHASMLEPPPDVAGLANLRATLLGYYQQARKLLPLQDTIDTLGVLMRSKEMEPNLLHFAQRLDSIPDPSVQDAAKEFLVLAQERFETYRLIRQKVAIAESKAARAAEIYRIFGEVTTKELGRIYDDVQDAFATYYREINNDDEVAFTAKLTPTPGKLSLDVDFYGRGPFPPGAYHSEGHQDAMGICLYLALMRHLLGTGFTFAVFDDVLMSVDAGHRRGVCAVLRKYFKDVQFILTTHDEIWLRHMRSEGLVTPGHQTHFRNWTVDHGPAKWGNIDIWQEIKSHADHNDIRSAAALLRGSLEHFAREACERLCAKVEFRGDAQYSLGELLPNAQAALSSAFKRAKQSANSWKHMDLCTKLDSTIASHNALFTAVNTEKWQLNAAVHYNEWENLQAEDFVHVMNTFQALLLAFHCDKCHAMLHVVRDGYTKSNLRCACGTVNYNLIPK